MKIRLGDETYTPAALDRISLRNLMRLEAETDALGRKMRWSDLRAIARTIGALPQDEAANHDDFPWFLGMLIWAARLEAGESVTFTEAIDFPLGDLEFIPEPGDEVSEPDPPVARPGSGRAGVRAPQDRKAKAKKKASARRSSDASS